MAHGDCPNDDLVEIDFTGGADRNRTDDLLNAIQALSQLSYSPETEVSIQKENGDVNAFPALLPLDPAKFSWPNSP